jgi:hypothetical protein
MCRFYKVKELDSRLRGNDNPVIPKGHKNLFEVLGLDPGIHLNSDDPYDDEEYEKEWCD